MKILMSNCGIKNGPNYSRTYCFAKELIKLGHEVTLLTAQNSNNIWPFKAELNDGVNVISFPDIIPKRFRRGGIGLFDVILRCLYAIGRDYDLVFADSGFRPAAGFPCWLYRLIKHKPYVCEWWDLNGRGGMWDLRSKMGRYTIGLYDSIMERFDKRIADGIVCLSNYLKDICIGMGIPNERVIVIHGGADIDRIKSIEKELARKIINYPSHHPLIGFVGINDSEILNLRPFLQAMPLLKKQFPAIKWFGTGGSLSSRIIKQFSIGKEYIETGWLSHEQYNAYLSSADVLLCLLEDNVLNKARWPNKLGDYLSAGRPVLTTAIGEVSIFIEKYPNSILMTEWNEKSVYRCIFDILSDTNKSKAIGENARNIAEIHYSWQSKARLLEDFLNKVITKHKSGIPS